MMDSKKDLIEKNRQQHYLIIVLFFLAVYGFSVALIYTANQNTFQSKMVEYCGLISFDSKGNVTDCGAEK